MLNNLHFEEMCKRIGGRVDKQLSGEPVCRAEHGVDGKVVLSRDGEVVRMEGTSDPILFEADADTLSLGGDKDSMVIQEAEGYKEDMFYEKATITFRAQPGPNEGVEILSGVGSLNPPRRSKWSN